MATIKSYTDIEQSKKLAEMLPLESADMYYPWYIEEDGDTIESGHRISTPNIGDFITHKVNKMILPCWSLAALRNLLPVAIKVNENTYLFESHNTFDKSWVYRYYNEDDVSYLYCKDTNEVDACVAMIEKLHESNLL